MIVKNVKYTQPDQELSIIFNYFIFIKMAKHSFFTKNILFNKQNTNLDHLIIKKMTSTIDKYK
jgi:hypothetical protein